LGEARPFLWGVAGARVAAVPFDTRPPGGGGGVWSVHIGGGTCDVSPDFADRADVRYTADAKAWCGVALGLTDPRDLVRSGLMTKDGGDIAMDHYFYQISQPNGGEAGDETASEHSGSPSNTENSSERRTS
jgi:hypothetical protein